MGVAGGTAPEAPASAVVLVTPVKTIFWIRQKVGGLKPQNRPEEFFKIKTGLKSVLGTTRGRLGKESVKARAKHLWDNFKLTIEQWMKIFAFQREVCAVCGQPNKSGNRLSTDHDHKSALVRGLLCQRCNRLFGKIENPRWEATPTLLRQLANYWENPTATAALGVPHYGYKGNVGTKTHRKLLKKLARAAERTKSKLKSVLPNRRSSGRAK